MQTPLVRSVWLGALGLVLLGTASTAIGAPFGDTPTPPQLAALRSCTPCDALTASAPTATEPVDGNATTFTFLGRGGNGAAYKADVTNPDGSHKVYVIKIAARPITNDAVRTERLADAAKLANVPGVARILDYHAPDKTTAPRVILEFAGDQNLGDYINSKTAPAPAVIISIMKQLATGLSNLHAAGFIHLDLKPGNVAIMPSASGDLTVKIIDVDDFHRVGNGTGADRQMLTTSTHRPPENPGQKSTPGSYMVPAASNTEKYDAWSLGIIYYELLLWETIGGIFNDLRKTTIPPARTPVLPPATVPYEGNPTANAAWQAYINDGPGTHQTFKDGLAKLCTDRASSPPASKLCSTFLGLANEMTSLRNSDRPASSTYLAKVAAAEAAFARPDAEVRGLDDSAFADQVVVDDDDVDFPAPTSGAVTVMFFTWNQDYCQDASLADLVNVELVEAHRPDLIILTGQEALRAPEGSPKYLSERLPEILANYEVVPGALTTIPGHTKGTAMTFARGTVGTQASRQGWNYLSVEVLKRKDSPYAGQDLSISTSTSKESTSGKGAAIATLTIGGKSLAFAGSYLDASSEANRNASLVHILRQIGTGSRYKFSLGGKLSEKVTEINRALDTGYHATFVLGDLNYRLNPAADLPLTSTVRDVSARLAGPTQWAALTALDSTQRSPLVTDFGFQCNDVRTIPPTYGRSYEPAAVTACKEFAKAPTAANAAACYFGGLKATDPVGSKHNQFQLGWPDRVCWRSRDGVKVTQRVVQDGRNVTCSDHVPSSTVVVIENAR